MAEGDTPKKQRVQQNSQPQVLSWPVDEDGQPMALVTTMAQELAPTRPMGNITVGPNGCMRPVRNDREAIKEAMIDGQALAQFVTAGVRRIITWAIDPSSMVLDPETGQPYPGHEAHVEPRKAAGDTPVAQDGSREPKADAAPPGAKA